MPTLQENEFSCVATKVAIDQGLCVLSCFGFAQEHPEDVAQIWYVNNEKARS